MKSTFIAAILLRVGRALASALGFGLTRATGYQGRRHGWKAYVVPATCEGKAWMGFRIIAPFQADHALGLSGVFPARRSNFSS
jgi:hypothetical protein